MNKKNIIFISVILLLGFVFWFFNNKSNSNNTYTVVLTAEGFNPTSLKIKEGDTVTFENKTENSFWPASDPHPTHGIFPEFDPRRPINASQTWSFKFDKAGTWPFHDHLNSLHTGEIIVEGKNKLNQNDCTTSSGKIQCWQNMLNQTLDKKGLPATFDLLASLYATEPEFAAECHSFTHEIGKVAYQKFALHKDFELNSKTSYCGYGFYHGFMETLLHTTGDIKQAKDFCKYVGEKLANVTTDGEGACYHGIGHGAVDGSDPTAWGDAMKILEPGIKMCESVSPGDTTRYGKLFRCVSGAYNALEILSSDTKYKLESIRTNPFSFCPSQKTQYQEACYTNMIPSLLRLTNNNLAEAEKYIEKIKEPNGYLFKESISSSMFVEFIRLNLSLPNYNIPTGIKLCQNTNNPYRIACVNGLAEGYMKYGDPTNAYSKGLAFCAMNELKDDEKDACYNSILPRLRIWYSEEKSKEICLSVEKKYQKMCLQGF